jgi:hypothetical protein
MIFDPATNTVFGSQGWVDRGSLWSLDLSSGLERRFAVEGAEYVSVRRHGPGLLRLSHHGLGIISIRACSDPDIELASLRTGPSGVGFFGDSALWGENFALFLENDSWRTDLAHVSGFNEAVRLLDMSWYNADNYDLGYQGLIDCLVMSEAGIVIVSVQRSSDLVLIDIETGTKTGTIPLAGRRGNPQLHKLIGSSLAASDYDVLCLVDLGEQTVTTSEVLQPADPQNMQQFVGDYVFEGDAVAIARPFSGDVLRLDRTTFAVLETVTVAGQPLSVCMVSDREFVTRDWKTGRVGRAEFGSW